ncbi:hypothetical protein ACJX0J_016594, partial [Zea mays]
HFPVHLIILVANGYTFTKVGFILHHILHLENMLKKIFDEEKMEDTFSSITTTSLHGSNISEKVAWVLDGGMTTRALTPAPVKKVAKTATRESPDIGIAMEKEVAEEFMDLEMNLGEGQNSTFIGELEKNVLRE